ncbi:MAG: large repetitive protein, partial [Bradyrhizobium sp.]|nr:large repetitive protein [Bradyrhizobium sp.]
LSVLEGGTVALGLTASAFEIDQNAPSIVISGLGSDTLSAGTDNHNGTWTLTTGQLSGLMLTVGAEETGPLSLHVVATDTETGTGNFASSSTDITVTVNEKADAPNLAAVSSSLSVLEGGTVALNLSASAFETDQNAPSIVIGGLGSDTLSAGTNNHDGTWTLTPGQLTGLTLTVGAEETGPLSLHVVATDTETGTGNFASSSTDITVTVNEKADAPNLSAPTTVSGNAGTPILLGITASHAEVDQHDPSIVISSIPTGATLTDANHDVLTITGGSITLTLSELNGLALTDASSASGTLHVVATDTETGSGNTASSSADIAYSVLQTDAGPPTGINFVLSTSGILAADNTSNGNQLNANTDLGTFVATGDPDPGDTFHYGLTGTDAGLFSLNTTSGELSVGASNVSVLTDGSGNVVPYHLTITAFDQVNNSTATSVSVWVAGAGADSLSGGSGIDIMFGMNGQDILTGNGGSDALLGGPNADTLTGGLGADQLVGGAGKDNFVYKAVNDSSSSGGIDTIYNFAAAGSSQDTIDFSAITTITATQGALANASTNVAAHSVAWIESGGNTIVYANTSTAAETQGHADMEIILTGINLNLTASDFILH